MNDRETLILLWINNKAKLSGSKETIKNYGITIADFFSFCDDTGFSFSDNATSASVPVIGEKGVIVKSTGPYF